MDLQNTFYTIGIIYMILNIFILVGIAVGVVLLVKMVVDLKKQVDDKVKKVQNIMDNPEVYAARVGTSILTAAVSGVKSIFSRKKEQA